MILSAPPPYILWNPLSNDAVRHDKGKSLKRPSVVVCQQGTSSAHSRQGFTPSSASATDALLQVSNPVKSEQKALRISRFNLGLKPCICENASGVTIIREAHYSDNAAGISLVLSIQLKKLASVIEGIAHGSIARAPAAHSDDTGQVQVTCS
ncbi:hypothetical protein PoB_004664900 [Plakobranchus ocellatus]|uniref:Uncharacterized protein n=1 Tax=Plakobranchus ocellatus TaxID=259542 RepID=A0AAV4BPA8_9GAST|nr:hypothetical protein PoB_004664900 [Plakobranchus ocellatus]